MRQCKECKRLRAENARLDEALAEWEEKEGSCCPENTSFVSVIERLRAGLAQAKGQNEWLLREQTHEESVRSELTRKIVDLTEIAKANFTTQVDAERDRLRAENARLAAQVKACQDLVHVALPPDGKRQPWPECLHELIGPTIELLTEYPTAIHEFDSEYSHRVMAERDRLCSLAGTTGRG